MTILANMTTAQKAEFRVAVDASGANGSTIIDVSTHGLTLSEAEASAARISFRGALGADAVFVLPVSRAQIIANDTTGAFALSVRLGSGLPLTIPSGETVGVR